MAYVDPPIANRGPRDRKRVTLKTISEATGFALTTVSRALKNEPEISAETRSKVQAVAAELGYRPDRAAQGLRTGRTLVVGLILAERLAVAEFERRIIAGVSKVIYDETAYNLVVFPHTDKADPMDAVRYFVESAQVDGLIFAHTTPQDPRAQYLLDRNIPFVTHGRTELAQQHAFHDFDNYLMAKYAVERLREKGRKRLALVPSTPELTCASHFDSGFFDAVRQAGVTGTVVPHVYLHDDPTAYREAARQLVASGQVPDGIVCGIETGCIALVAGFQEAGLVVGRDVDVIAKSTSDLLDYISPRIDSFHEDLTLAGETLARFLIKRIEGTQVSKLQTVALPEPRLRT